MRAENLILTSSKEVTYYKGYFVVFVKSPYLILGEFSL